MQKNPITTDKQLPEEPKRNISKKRKKKKKKGTECSAKIQMHNTCGICGSEDLIEQRLIVCEQCGKEVYKLDFPFNFNYYSFKDKKEICKCTREVKFRNRLHEYPSKKVVFKIINCVTCGAYKGPLCPNCKKGLWFRQDPDGTKKHCTGLWRGCGYRINL